MLDYLDRAQHLRQEGRLDGAIASYRQAIQVDRQNPWAYYFLGDLLVEKGQLDQAELSYRQVIQLNPDFHGAYEGLGRLLKRQNQVEAAIDCYQQATQLNPQNVWNHHALGELLTKQGQLEQAVSHLRQAIALKPDFHGSYEVLGQNLEKLNQIEAAIDCYQQAIQINPANAWSHYALGKLLIAQQQPDAALPYLQQALALDENVLFCSQLANLLREQGQAAEAAQYFRQAIRLEPSNPWFHYSLGQSLATQQQFPEAIGCYQTAIDLNPGFPGAYVSLADVYRQLNQIEAAIDYYQQALDRGSTSVWTGYNLGRLLRQQGRFEEAATAYHRGIKLQPIFSDALCSELKHTYGHLSSEGLTTAIAFHETLLATQPHNPLVNICLGDLLTLQGRREEAIVQQSIATRKKVLQTHPQFVHQHWQPEPISAPDFLMIGTMKSGTTSLYEYMVQHPNILPSSRKEIEFFNLKFDYGIDWYLAHFPPISQDLDFVTGEASPLYFYSFVALTRIAANFPKTKLILLLRNPVDRAFSHYQMSQRIYGNLRPIEDILDSEFEKIKHLHDLNDLVTAQKSLTQMEQYLSCSLYVYFLARWLQAFPKEQLLILKGEDLYTDPIRVMTDVFSFLELSNQQLPEYKNYFPGKYTPMELETRQRLHQYFQPHNQRLEEYLNRDFGWTV